MSPEVIVDGYDPMCIRFQPCKPIDDVTNLMEVPIFFSTKEGVRKPRLSRVRLVV